MTDQERMVMEMALEALQVMKAGQHAEEKAYMDKAIEALRQALAQDKQEPVAYVTGTYGGHFIVQPIDRAMVLNQGMALYAAPLKPDLSIPPECETEAERNAFCFGWWKALEVNRKEWVGLTDEEIKSIIADVAQIPPIDFTSTTYARAIEAALKEKNT